MFKSLPILESRALSLLRSYASWVDVVDRDVLSESRDSTAGDLYATRTNAEEYLRNFRLIRDDADWPKLTQDVRDDVTAAIEEIEALGAEMDVAFSEDAIWSDSDAATKRRWAIELPVTAAKKRGVADRLALRKRGVQ